MTRLYRILRAALVAAEQNALIQAAILLAVIYCVVAQWR